ncbi:uncharacterized protein LOC131257617 [Magnolia sinica]|uniref:uncharacterized protein LOC131257617 n=1 Tax=Magnolia sinica TaxID=86752 RepID=UPI00265A2F10|nr:uncharacterized protein LOC131257617 [Magnolia sinica]
MLDFSEKQKKLWSEWELRILVLCSLFLQIFLTISAPFRRRKSAKWIRPFIWASYLLADWVAAFALGILSDSITSSPDCNNSHCTNINNANELIVFWSPFLLIHLGGPDTITALALEDNELWLRHLLALIINLIGTVYVFIRTLPNNHFLIPTLIIFTVGIIRYIQRTCSLYLASSGVFRRSIGKESKTSNSSGFLPEPVRGRINSIEAVQSAHRFLTTYSRLIVDSPLSFENRDQSRSYFMILHPEDAFGIIEVELGLLFDMLYTKATVIHNYIGYFFRLICFSFILIALLLFILFDKRRSHLVDRFITYILFIGALTIDLIDLFHLIRSNWLVHFSENRKLCCLADQMFAKLHPDFPLRHHASMSQCNLISYCLRRHSSTCLHFKCNFIDEVVTWLQFKCNFIKNVPVSTNIKSFIFNDLLNKSKAENSLNKIKEMFKYRWNWAIEEGTPDRMPDWFFNVDLEERILIWHIATDICYHSRDCKSLHRDVSKLVSDYMLYLLVIHPTMISSTEGIAESRWKDVCQLINKFIEEGDLKDDKSLCRKLLEKHSLTDRRKIERSDDLLKNACLVAHKLLNQPEIFAWVNISRVWVELLCSGANHCSGKDHAQRLAWGGEFLTTVWLLKAHLGLAHQYRVEFNDPQASAD